MHLFVKRLRGASEADAPKHRDFPLLSFCLQQLEGRTKNEKVHN